MGATMCSKSFMFFFFSFSDHKLAPKPRPFLHQLPNETRKSNTALTLHRWMEHPSRKRSRPTAHRRQRRSQCNRYYRRTSHTSALQPIHLRWHIARLRTQRIQNQSKCVFVLLSNPPTNAPAKPRSGNSMFDEDGLCGPRRSLKYLPGNPSSRSILPHNQWDRGLCCKWWSQ